MELVSFLAYIRLRCAAPGFFRNVLVIRTALYVFFVREVWAWRCEVVSFDRSRLYDKH